MSNAGRGGGEKTEKPTPKRLKEARREGRVARSADVGAWAGILVTSLVLPWAVSRMATGLRELVVQVGAFARSEADPEVALALLGQGLAQALLGALAVGVPLLVVGLAGNIAQGGMHLASKQLKPQVQRMNPVSGVKRMAGPQAMWELVKALIKSAVIGLLVYRSVSAMIPLLVGSGHLPLGAVLGILVGAIISLIRYAAVAGLVMAAADYAVIRRRLGKQLRMSRQEVKDELRTTEGDPHVKGAIRSRQLAMSRNRMIAAVADADVVVVNPTHVAVALRYEPVRGAPRVVAKGAGAIAARIRAEADTHRVPMVADVPLARAIYRACDVGTAIPAELYAAVAQVLAFVLALRARGSAAGTHHLPPSGASRRSLGPADGAVRSASIGSTPVPASR